MASKKFSRLSIMLEAKDNMSKNLNNAAKASQNLGRNVDKLGGKRATFNQLADANAKLNKEVANLNSQLTKANNRLGKMKGHLGSLNGIGTAFAGFYAAQGAVHATQGAAKSTIGTAMEQNYNEQSVGILAGAENGAKYWKQIQDYAVTTAFSSSEWAANMRSAIGKSKNVDDLKKYQTVMEQLATLDPVQGLEGAALAVRELNSGDTMSLVERFELPRKAMNDIKKIQDPIKQIEELSKFIGVQTGYTVENIQKMKELPMVQWQKFSNLTKNTFGQIGKGMLEVLAPALKKVNDYLSSGKMTPYIVALSNAFGNMAEGVGKTFKAMVGGFDLHTFIEKARPFTTLIGNIVDSIKQAWPNISGIFRDIGDIFAKTANNINSNWPSVNSLFQTFVGYVKDVSGWINDHWSQALDTTIALGVAIMSFKTITTVVAGWKALTLAITMYRDGAALATIAQTAFNVALWTNPITWVIAAIVALIAVTVLLIRHWDEAKAAVVSAYNTIDEKLGAFKYLVLPVMLLVDAGIALYKNWAVVEQAAEEMWVGIQNAFVSGVNACIEDLNRLIDLVNKIPGISIDHAQMMKYVQTSQQQAASSVTGAGDNFEKRARINGSHATGLGYVPFNGYVAKLHKGERVLTSQENKEYNKEMPTISGNTFIVRQDSDIDAIAAALFRKLTDAQLAMGGAPA